MKYTEDIVEKDTDDEAKKYSAEKDEEKLRIRIEKEIWERDRKLKNIEDMLNLLIFYYEIADIRVKFTDALKQSDYTKCLELLLELEIPLDQFLNAVRLDEADAKIVNKASQLFGEIKEMFKFGGVADFSKVAESKKKK